MISGLNLINDFITESQESELIVRLASEWRVSVPSGGGLRQVRYGTDVYAKKLASEVIPEYLLEYCRVIYSRGLLDHEPRHVTINTYKPGSYIGPHIDKPDCGEVITILSVASDATMIMSKDVSVEISLGRRSLIQLSGESRYDWKHEILPVEHCRYSLVFRD
jgi:alkylated DNA repair protein alkB family protein 8